MMEDTWRRLDEQFTEFPVSRSESVSEAEVDAALAAVGRPFPSDYREFVIRYGGAAVGSYPIFGVRSAEVMSDDTVVDINETYRADGWPGADEWLIVSMDLGGNPVGISEDGRVWTHDHDVQQTFLLADSFEQFLRRECMGLPE
jgi:hypothetical protein